MLFCPRSGRAKGGAGRPAAAAIGTIPPFFHIARRQPAGSGTTYDEQRAKPLQRSSAGPWRLRSFLLSQTLSNLGRKISEYQVGAGALYCG